jgi:hypothetical protein
MLIRPSCAVPKPMALVLLLLLIPTTAEAQDWKFRFGFNGWASRLGGVADSTIPAGQADAIDLGMGGGTYFEDPFRSYFGQFGASTEGLDIWSEVLWKRENDLRGPTLPSAGIFEAAALELGMAKPISGIEGLEWIAGVRLTGANFSAAPTTTPSAVRFEARFYDPWAGLRYQRELSGSMRMVVRGDIGGFGIGSDLVWRVDLRTEYWISQYTALQAGYLIYDLDGEDSGLNLHYRIEGFTGGFRWTFGQ